MQFPEGLKTVRYDREGVNVVEEDQRLKRVLKMRIDYKVAEPADDMLLNFYLSINLLGRLKPLDLEEWAEEHYNVMA